MRHAVMGLACLAAWVMCLGSACQSSVAPPDPQPAEFESVTLTHAGFDFSEGVIPSDWEASDGHTTNWPCFPTINAAKEYSNYVWFAPFANTDTQNFTKDMGAVALSSVLNVPTVWDAGAGLTLEPLEVGHVYVIKCLDGYAKFLVKAIDASQDHEWAVQVEYAYTAGSTFDE